MSPGPSQAPNTCRFSPFPISLMIPYGLILSMLEGRETEIRKILSSRPLFRGSGGPGNLRRAQESSLRSFMTKVGGLLWPWPPLQLSVSEPPGDLDLQILSRV